MSYSQIFPIFQAKRRETGQMVARPRALISLGKVKYFGKKTIFSSNVGVLRKFCTLWFGHGQIPVRACPSEKPVFFF